MNRRSRSTYFSHRSAVSRPSTSIFCTPISSLALIQHQDLWSRERGDTRDSIVRNLTLPHAVLDVALVNILMPQSLHALESPALKTAERPLSEIALEFGDLHVVYWFVGPFEPIERGLDRAETCAQVRLDRDRVLPTTFRVSARS